MDLGRVFTVVQFNRSEQTTWIIDKLHGYFDIGEVYDTVKLGWVLSIIEKGTVYPISLFIKNRFSSCDKAHEICEVNKRFCGTTFSLLKYKYADRGFNADECVKDDLLSKVYSAYLSAQTKELDTFLEFDSPYCFKAQSSYAHESDGFGRSFCYYIVGISIGKPFKSSRY